MTHALYAHGNNKTIKIKKKKRKPTSQEARSATFPFKKAV
jgi:hypothetical protein